MFIRDQAGDFYKQDIFSVYFDYAETSCNHVLRIRSPYFGVENPDSADLFYSFCGC